MPDAASLAAAASQLACLCWRSAATCLKSSLAGTGKTLFNLIFFPLLDWCHATRTRTQHASNYFYQYARILHGH